MSDGNLATSAANFTTCASSIPMCMVTSLERPVRKLSIPGRGVNAMMSAYVEGAPQAALALARTHPSRGRIARTAPLRAGHALERRSLLAALRAASDEGCAALPDDGRASAAPRGRLTCLDASLRRHRAGDALDV